MPGWWMALARGRDRPSGTVLLEASGAQFRADQVLTALLALIVFGNFVTQPLGLAADRLDGRRLVAGLVGPLVGAWYGAWLLREARSSTDQSGTPTRLRRPSADLVFIVAMAAAGLATEAVVLPPLVAASMNNTGFGCLAAAAYAAAFTLPRRTSILILLAVSVGHAVAPRTMPTESLQGAAELAVIWAGTRLVVAEVRQAARDAQDAADAARRAEREEASARVHDALGLLRVVARGDGAGEGLQRAAQETARRTEVWLQDCSGGPTLAQAIVTVIGQFPDLDVVLDVTRLSVPADPGVVTAVGRAVHTLLGNVREHAEAARVDITAADAPGGWILTIHDDGRGFDVAATTPGGGLSRYTHAALDAVGVAMTLVSAPAAGTTVTLRASASGLPADRPGSRRVGRFAAWRARPAGGLARAAWISDVMQAALVASFAVMVMTGYPHLLGHSQRPTGAGALVAAGAVLLTVTWLGGPRPPRVLAVAATVVAVAAGGVITVLNGSDAMIGDKLGIMLMAWSCMLLSAARPEYRWISVGLAIVPLVVFGHVNVISGLVGALLVVMGSLVAARLVSALTDLGTGADADRHRAAASERRTAARLLHRQAAVISDAAATTTPATDQLADRLAAVAKQAEHYLRPPRECTLGAGLQARLGSLPDFGDRLDLDTTQLTADLAAGPVGSIVDAVAEIAATLLRAASTGRVSVRAVGEATRWQLSLLAELADAGSAAEDPPVVSARVGANLATAGIAVTIRVMPGGDHYVELRPMGPGTRQETAIAEFSQHQQARVPQLSGPSKPRGGRHEPHRTPRAAAAGLRRGRR